MSKSYPRLQNSAIGRLVAGAPVAVLGFGVSNRPLVRLLLALGCEVRVYDDKSVSELGEQAAELSARGVAFYQEETALPLDGVRAVFRSPGIHPDTPLLARARAKNIPVTSEMAWFLATTPATVLAVTGSDGKTTTTSLVAAMLTAGGRRVHLGGNIGTPLLDRVEDMTPDDFAVLELSSFQLYDLPPACVPHRAAITNLSPNHLNWHADMDDYVGAKKNIFGGQRCELLVTNADNALTRAIAEEERTRRAVTLFSSSAPDAALLAAPAGSAVCVEQGWLTLCQNGQKMPVVAADEVLLPGQHNVENIMAALALCANLVPPEAMRQVARTFRGVEHRLQQVREAGGITFYNSSIDTSPTRTVAALSAINTPMVVICGGRDKHIPFDPLATALCAKAHTVVLTGEAMGQIEAALLACPDYDPARLTLVREPDFEAAVRAAARHAHPGDAVLLSPACTSFDAFPHFAARGEAFCRIVADLKFEDKGEIS